jgi:putative DNA-invertase from lambdoid prophage Rac
MATILYARVSTNKQTIEHQRTQAEQAGFRRPQGRRLFDLLRSGDALVVRWVDRLGRNYQDICDALREFTRRGVVIRTVINGITRSTARHKDAMQCAIRDALIAFMAATAEAQAEATKEAQRAGIAHAKANCDVRACKGRKPSYSPEQFENAQAMLGKSGSVGEVARATGLTRQTVYRIKDDPAAAEAALATWGINSSESSTRPLCADHHVKRWPWRR